MDHGDEEVYRWMNKAFVLSFFIIPTPFFFQRFMTNIYILIKNTVIDGIVKFQQASELFSSESKFHKDTFKCLGSCDGSLD